MHTRTRTLGGLAAALILAQAPGRADSVLSPSKDESPHL